MVVVGAVVAAAGGDFTVAAVVGEMFGLVGSTPPALAASARAISAGLGTARFEFGARVVTGTLGNTSGGRPPAPVGEVAVVTGAGTVVAVVGVAVGLVLF